MNEFIHAVFHMSLLIAAFFVARSGGYIAGKGIETPWYTDGVFWMAFFALIIIYQITEPKP